jgi:hypothetical protein
MTGTVPYLVGVAAGYLAFLLSRRVVRVRAA